MKTKMKPKAFTLIELLVVIAIIALIAAMTIPTVSNFFESGADAQTYQLLDASVRAARAYAMEHQVFAGVHIQHGNGAIDKPDTGFACVVAWNPETNVFGRATGFEPIEFPGNMSFGHVQKENNTMHADGSYKLGDPAMFLTMTIVFNPDGKLVRTAGASRIRFDPNDPLFKGDLSIWSFKTAMGGSGHWTGGEVGAEVVTLLHLPSFRNAGQASVRVQYMNESGRFIGINHYTGQLFPRE
ncbi:MAG: prepilin-type N-terminal cleavage/methylation domain-containing protein [Phycisphaerae bacterium]